MVRLFSFQKRGCVCVSGGLNDGLPCELRYVCGLNCDDENDGYDGCGDLLCGLRYVCGLSCDDENGGCVWLHRSGGNDAYVCVNLCGVCELMNGVLMNWIYV